MAAARQILFIQGGGEGTHDRWDAQLVASLARELGDGHDIRYPRMPHEDDPAHAPWSEAIRAEMIGLRDGAIVIGHSVGGTLLAQTLAERPPPVRLAAIVLIAAPFVGAGGWPADELAFTSDLGAVLSRTAPVHLVHGLDDETVPVSHAELYARTMPQAHLHLLPHRDHQLGNDLSDVAEVIQRS